MEDFSKDRPGEMVIEFLQMKHKCVITVQDSAADTRYYTLTACTHLLLNGAVSRNLLTPFYEELLEGQKH